MNQQTLKEIEKLFASKGCTILKIEKKTIPIEYMCACGKEKKQLYKDFVRRNCRWCRDKKLKEKPVEEIEDNDDIYGDKEIWKPVVGGWISNFGNAKNSLGKILTLCPQKFRYRINGKHQYASRLVAEAFQIENYDNINNSEYIVSHIDNIPSNNRINNLKIIKKSELIHDSKTHQSENFQDKVWWLKDKFNDINNIIIKELPKHIIYYNGEIWNGTRFLTFSKSDNYLTLCTLNKTYKVHRLICYAFHSIEGKNNLIDYDDLQVNHKDGNKLNNHADNLEWVSNSENMFHSYNSNLNKKVRNILQYTKDNIFIKEFNSIAQASRETGELEHRIRETAKGKGNSKAEFLWKFKNEEETNEYSQK